MSNRPFNDYADKYLETVAKDLYAEETYKTRKRRYRRMNEDVVALRKDKQISTMSPKDFTPEDITVILLNHKKKVNVNDMEHEVVCLRKLCEFAGNNAVTIALARNPGLKPKCVRKRKESMSDETYKLILDRAKSIDPNDYYAIRAYAFVLLLIRTGCRNKEIRFADVTDIDTDNWIMEIRHVKGEKSYGEPRAVPIHPEIRSVVWSYITTRKKWLLDKQYDSQALFPPQKGAKDYYLSSNAINSIACYVWKDLEIKSDPRQCRRTFGQKYLDDDVDIESVSVLMGHHSTRMTESFYGRRKLTKAMETAMASWETTYEAQKENC